MKKLFIGLPALAICSAMASQEPILTIAQSESQAMNALYDAELTEVKLSRDGPCFKFDALSVFDRDKTKPLHGQICGDKITFN